MIHDDTENPWLDRRLAALREELETRQAPAAVEAKLLQAFARRHRRPWVARAGQWFAPAIGLAASAGMAAWIALAPVSDAGIAERGATVAAGEDGAPFLALQPLERIAAEREPRLIETTVPRVMLASLGLPVNPEVAGESMRAQMLVAADGEPLAMRLSR